MDKRPQWGLFYLVLLFLLVGFGCGGKQSSELLEKHFKEYPEIRKKYVYQSVLRLANIRQDPDFNKLIRDVDKIIIYLPPKEDSTYQIKGVMSGIRSAGYEELISVRTARKENISLWVNESLSTPHYIGLLDTSGDDYIFELDGELDLEYASTLNLVDQETLRSLIN